ncbi:MAG: VCBS repeat-containing protein [Planctomycetes bacterium]|nr:VCBS repeat-containing protein [Planctomycetota bacterium]
MSSLPAQWVTFQDQTSTRLVAANALGAGDTQEKDYAWADFDKDGDTDLFVARKQPFTTPGKYPNVLLMNENGVLTDRTALYGSNVSPALALEGSQGMLDSTNDRDVVAVDVNGDLWVDLVTCTTLSDTVVQFLRVPRVYINLGDGGIPGNWLGFAYDDKLRIDDTPWGGFQRFCSVAAGDIDHDGDMDLYFGDYQQGGSRPVDLNDRLLLNNGSGYFTDVSSSRMTVEMLESSFGMKVAMVDMNGDGWVDILKDDALNAPQAVSISYSMGAASPGNYGIYQLAYGNAPYHFAVGDLNNDLLPDMIFSDDGQDRYKLMTGVTTPPPGQVPQAVFGPEVAFSYTSGGDDGFGGNNLIVDLNNDGFNDAIICDVDVDISGCGRRAHIFRNLGNTPNVTLKEELSGGQVCGIPTSMLVGSFDAAVFDINGDGWKDIVLGRCSGTTVWINQPPVGMAFSYPSGLPSLLSPGAIHSFTVQATGIGGVVPQAGTGVLHYSVNGAPFQTSPLWDLSPGLYLATLPQMPGCTSEVEFYVTVQGTGAVTYKDPATAPTSTNRVISAVGTNVLYENNMEGAVTGWSVVNTALSTGAWEVAVPNGTTTLGQFAAPPEDGEASASNTKCWVTQNGAAGGAAGTADVDGGPTDLFSPTIDMAGTDGTISYRRWFFSDGADVMQVHVSGDGVSWVPVETVIGSGNNQWTTASFRVSDFIVPTNAVRVRFRIQDVTPGNIVEGGIDLFRAEAYACTLCQEDIGPLGPGTATFSICGGDLSNGTTATFSVVGAPSSAPAILLGSLFNLGSPFAGGLLIDPAPPIGIGFAMDASGSFVVPGFPGGLGSFEVYAQVVYQDAGQTQGWGFTNGLLIRMKP